MDLFLSAGGGFLVAVIWMDLMFDVLALQRRSAGNAALDEPALASIAGYYRRVTTEASPMNLLISVVMASLVAGIAWQWATGKAGAGTSAASLALCGVPISLALLRVFPNAIRLGSRRDGHATQSLLARSIAIDHLFCLAAMLAFVLLRIFAAH